MVDPSIGKAEGADRERGGSLAGGSMATVRALRSYKDTALKLFPQLPRAGVDTWSITDHDALVCSDFIQMLGGSVVVFEIGTFIGVSAFHFAAQPTVRRVVTVDPNPVLADEVNQSAETIGLRIADSMLARVRVLDVAEGVLGKFPAERTKVEIEIGVAAKSGPDNAARVVQVPTPEMLGDDQLVAYVDGRHTREAVCADLDAIFAAHPACVAILDDCRYAWGPYVQAGVAAFLEGAAAKHHFRLFADVAPALGRSNLGLVYSGKRAADMQHVLTRFAEAYSRRFDLLKLLEREEEIGAIAAAQSQELTVVRRNLEEAQRMVTDLEEAQRILTQVLRSRSWRITQPLRLAFNALQKAVSTFS